MIFKFFGLAFSFVLQFLFCFGEYLLMFGMWCLLRSKLLPSSILLSTVIGIRTPCAKPLLDYYLTFTQFICLRWNWNSIEHRNCIIFRALINATTNDNNNKCYRLHSVLLLREHDDLEQRRNNLWGGGCNGKRQKIYCPRVEITSMLSSHALDIIQVSANGLRFEIFF